jgi:hypothetical protein
MHAGHSSIGRLLGPAARLLVLAGGCLLPAAIALRGGSQRVALIAGVLAMAGYYFVVLHPALASHLLYARVDQPASGAQA